MNNDQVLVDIEVARIKAGPHSGNFTFLHHEGPVVERSHNVMERVEYILTAKPPSEIYTRLRHIYRVPENLAEKAYQDAIVTARREMTYQDAIVTARREKAVIALIPDCSWNGKTIFPDGPRN